MGPMVVDGFEFYFSFFFYYCLWLWVDLVGRGNGGLIYLFPSVVYGGEWMLVGAMVEVFFFSAVVYVGGWMWLVEAMVGFCWLWHGW